MRKQRTIKRIREGNDYVLHIPLDDDGKDYCIVDEFDWKELTSLGMSGRIYVGDLKKPAVWISSQRRGVFLQRLIVDAGPNEVVCCRDGNDRNLRKSNLMKVPSKRGKHRDRDYLTKGWQPIIEDVTG